MPKPCSGHSPGLDVGVAITSGDDYDHPAAESGMMFVLSAVVPWAFHNAINKNHLPLLCTSNNRARSSPYLCFQMAEEGWTQGDCQAAPGFPSLLINALESLGVTERPRYYSREYEHHGTLRCRVILVIARSDRYPDIQSWRVTATGFRHQDTYPLAIRKTLRYLCRIFEEHLAPTSMRFFPPAIRTQFGKHA